ncbi:hypothetical protein NW768_008688 [Fusarium equiseti]|uniref:Hsp70 protein n=1 Tax=Fusarium equiseti TaxID=61235 RepID=A0ABQ8R512_FUSEQ|nr:hypothetical protein NW768_008688 [Fusarium equiseti]
MPPPHRQRGQLVVAVDFGTTSTAVSFVLVPEGTNPQHVSPDAIETIENWPTCIQLRSSEPMRMEVPTVITYPTGWDFQSRTNPSADDPPPISSFDDMMREMRKIRRDSHGGLANDEVVQPRWGYQVHRDLGLVSTHDDPSKRPAINFKPLFGLVESERELRRDGTNSLRDLHSRTPNRHMITLNDLHLRVTVDFFIFVLQHTKNELEAKDYDITSTEVVVCVLESWSSKVLRKMQSCVTAAMKHVHFPGIDPDDNSIDRVFMVTEPEAAATYMLTGRGDIRESETFVQIDAGGGTVNGSTHKVTAQAPLRLEKLVVDPDSDTCGSTQLNAGFRRLLHQLLDDQTYLEDGQTTIQGIIEGFVFKDFEYDIKRSFNLSERPVGYHRIHLKGLRKGVRPDLNDNELAISRESIYHIFMNVFKRAAKVMTDQLDKARRKRISVDKVVVIGGLASNPSFLAYMQQKLAMWNYKNRSKCKIQVPDEIKRGMVINAVASGAVLRALDKRNGPSRQARCSYGLLRLEPQDPEGRKGSRNAFTKDRWLRTIYWVIQKGSEIVPSDTKIYEAMTPFPVYDGNSRNRFRGPYICRQDIYLSDTAYKCHQDENDEHNLDAEHLGYLEFDVSRYYERGRFLTRQAGQNHDGVVVTEPHTEFHWQIHFVVNGLNLACCAVVDGNVEAVLKVNMASGFDPSTE